MLRVLRFLFGLILDNCKSCGDLIVLEDRIILDVVVSCLLLINFILIVLLFFMMIWWILVLVLMVRFGWFLLGVR